MSILHLAGSGPITDKFFPFIEENLDCSGHQLLSFSKKSFNFQLKTIEVITRTNIVKSVVDFYIYSNKAEKIIIHGLFGWHLTLLLALNPWLLKRCYWVIWGGDLYYRKLKVKSFKSKLFELLRKFVIRKTGHFITHIEGDYKLAQQWYGAKGQWHECFMYPSNLYKDYPLQPKAHDTINIQVGNSADPSNNHLEVLEKLKTFRDQDIQIYVPLSYGDQKYAQNVIAYGIEIFGDKFIPLTEFMPFEKYLDLLSAIDIAIFNHRRQQGMGNITTLLGLGKKVYMRDDITSWMFIRNLGLFIYDINNINLNQIEKKMASKNKEKIISYFSKEKLAFKLKEILNEPIS